jgi:hypothetical protein
MRRYPCLLLGPFLLGTAACAADSVAGPRAAPEVVVANDLKAFEQPHEDGTIILYRGRANVAAVPPLVIVNGAEWTEPLDRLDPANIASVEVLKVTDAGERGVIVITTRNAVVKALPGKGTL